MSFWEEFKVKFEKEMESAKVVLDKGVEVSKHAIDKTSNTIREKTLMAEFGANAQKLGVMVFEKIEQNKSIDNDLEIENIVQNLKNIKAEVEKISNKW